MQDEERDRITYTGWDTTKLFVENVMQQQGPFDGIMGFSQVSLPHKLVTLQRARHPSVNCQVHCALSLQEQCKSPERDLIHKLEVAITCVTDLTEHVLQGGACASTVAALQKLETMAQACV